MLICSHDFHTHIILGKSPYFNCPHSSSIFFEKDPILKDV